MKRVLILSIFALPKDIIASYRTMAYLKHFNKYGYEPTLVTPYWGVENQRTPKNEVHQGGLVHRIPEKQSFLGRLFSSLEKIPVINKVSILLRWSIGFLDPTADDINTYVSYKAYCERLLAENEFDLILGIYSPHHHLKLCYELHRKFNIPYVLDFRDLWHNRIIHKSYQPNSIEDIQDFLTKYHWKKWLSEAAFFSITSGQWRDKILEFSDTKNQIIPNGFDSELFTQYQLKSNTNNFTVIHAGALYSHQKLEIFLQGCQQFIDEVKPNNFIVKFIGADRKGTLSNQLSGFLFEPKKQILSQLDGRYCEVTGRIAKTALVEEIGACQLLLFPGLPDAPGTHLGKIFDYIASSKNILMIPDDHSVVGDLIRDTKTGIIANTSQEACDQLTKYYQEWQKTGTLAYHGDQDAINLYTRENQVKRMAKAIDQFFEDL